MGCACQPALSGAERKRKGWWMSGGELKAQKGNKTKKREKKKKEVPNLSHSF